MDAPTDASQRHPRRGYLDWMRGLAVLIMIEAHVVDSWATTAGRDTAPFRWSMILAGLGAPLFLFLAGVAVALSAGAKGRRTGDAAAASGVVARRGLEVFGLAFVFRVQSWILGWSPARTLLKVDILNVMGPSIAAAAVVWGRVRTTRGRVVALGVAAALIALLTPIVRELAWLGVLPDPIEAYARPVRPFTSFAFFPWSGFVFAGAVIGVLLDERRASETRTNLMIFAGGCTLALAAYGASFMPSPYARSEFWTSSPAFFLLRTGLMTLAIPLAYLWQSRRADARWSPLQQLGRSSLFVYWIHVELVYGLISLPLHKALTLRQAWLAFAAFSVLMLLCSMGKDRVVAWWRGEGPRTAPVLAPHA